MISPMISKDALIGGVLAATDTLVKQAGDGDWSSVAKTVEQRHALLEQLAKTAPQSGEHDFLKALRAAVAESDAAVAVMSNAQQPAPATRMPQHSGRLCTKA